MHAGDIFAGKGTAAHRREQRRQRARLSARRSTKARSGIKNVDTIITGHSTAMTLADLKEYADFNNDFVTWVQGEMKAGKTVDAAAAEYKLPERYKGYAVSTFRGGIKGNIQVTYNELEEEVGCSTMTRAIVLGTLIGARRAVAGGLRVPGAAAAGPTPAALAATKIEKVKDNLYIITGSGADDRDGVQRRQHRRLHHRHRRRRRRHQARRLGSDDPRPDQDGDQQADHDDHQHAHARRSHRQQRVLRRERRDRSCRRTRRRTWRRWTSSRATRRKFLPKRTYKDKLTIGAGKDQIDLYYFGRGHTNGDTFVVFPALRTMHAGDMFAWKALPFIDPTNGGSGVEQPKTLAKAVAGVKNVDTVINGHIPVATWNDLKEYAEFTQDFVDVRGSRDEGRQDGGPGRRRNTRSRRNTKATSPAPTSSSAARKRTCKSRTTN